MGDSGIFDQAQVQHRESSHYGLWQISIGSNDKPLYNSAKKHPSQHEHTLWFRAQFYITERCIIPINPPRCKYMICSVFVWPDHVQSGGWNLLIQCYSDLMSKARDDRCFDVIILHMHRQGSLALIKAALQQGSVPMLY